MSRPGRAGVLPVVLAAALAAVSCGRIPPTHYYMIELRPPAGGAGDAASGAGGSHDGAAQAGGLVVGVAPFHVDPPYDQDRIVYRVGSGSPEVGFYTYHRWAASLSRMLPGAVAAALDGVAGLASIEPAAPGRDYPATLDGRLRVLEEIDLPEGQQVRLHLSLALRLADDTPVWSGEVRGERTIRAGAVDELVAGFTETLEAALREARDDLQRALAARTW